MDKFVELDIEGWKPGAPSPQAEEIDSRVCNDAKCPDCGWNGLIYRPFTKGISYRAFAVCPDCGHVDEF